MTPPPIVLGLNLCEKVIVEEGTRNVSLVSTFEKLTVDGFPSPPQRFALYALLTNGLGDGTIDVVVTRLETDQTTYSHRLAVRFPSPLQDLRLLLRIRECSFPAPGTYQFTLLIDGEWLAQRRLHVVGREVAS
jgi:hypothetical protein